MPSPTTQKASNTTVSRKVPTYLLLPFFYVGLWGNVFATAVSMPKTTINENHQSFGMPYEVWIAGQRLISAPAVKAGFS
jgi:hypothetical protein